MKRLLVLTSMILISLVSWAQNDKRYIEVLGSAEIEISPNIIVVGVRLKEYEENKVKVTLEKMEKDFLQAVSESKIEKKNIELSDLTVNAIFQKKRDREVYSQKTYQITFSKNEDVMVLLGNLKNVKLDYLEITKISHTEIEKYRLETKIEALKAAERKADALLNSVNVKRGKPILIQEDPQTNNFRPYDLTSNTMMYAPPRDEPMEASEIPLKKIKLRFEILARFEIE